MTAQPIRARNSTDVDEDIYERVIETVFPREILKDKTVRFAFVLRYQPPFQSESQIVIVGRQNGIEVTTLLSLWQKPNGHVFREQEEAEDTG